MVDSILMPEKTGELISLRLHPFCEIFPPMDEADFEKLKTDIAHNGLLEPILIYEDQILDGRHRYRACQELEIIPSETFFRGTASDALTLVTGRNLHRRHLSTSQKAAIAAEMSTFWDTLDADIAANLARRTAGESIPDEERVDRTKAIADSVGVSRDSISKAKSLREKDPGLLDRIKAGKINVNQAVKLKDLPPETKAQALEAIDQGEPPKQVIKSVLHPGGQGVANGGTDEWPTPDEILEQVYDFFPDGIDLDPASNEPPNVKCKRYFTKEDDGLSQIWTGKTLWMNHPFALSTEFSQKWVNFFAANDAEGVALFKLDPRVSWFETMIENCQAYCMVRGYVKFKGAQSSFTVGIILFYYGPRAAEFCDRFSVLGWCTDVGLQDTGRDEFLPEIRKDAPLGPFRVGDRVSIDTALSDQEAFALGYPTYSEVGTIRYSSPETSSVKWDGFDPALMVAIPTNHLTLISEGKGKTSRFKEGDRVQVPESFKPEAIKKFNLPPVKTSGVVKKVEGNILTILWESPWGWQDLSSDKVCQDKRIHKESPQEGQAIQVGDRVAMRLFPSIQGEVLVLLKTSAHIRFDDSKKVERKRSLRKVKSYSDGDVFNTPLTAIIKVEEV